MHPMTTSKDTWYKTELIPPEEREFYVPIPESLKVNHKGFMVFEWCREKTDEELKQQALEELKRRYATQVKCRISLN